MSKFNIGDIAKDEYDNDVWIRDNGYSREGGHRYTYTIKGLTIKSGYESLYSEQELTLVWNHDSEQAKTIRDIITLYQRVILESKEI